MIRRTLTTLLLAGALLVAAAAPALAGSPHFVDDQTSALQDGSTLTATFKEAGLGDEAQVSYVLSADAKCVNPGGNDPQAGNKTSVSTAATLPVQNGKVSGTLSVTATFQPSCDPPMDTEFTHVTLTDVTNGLVFTFVGWEY